NLAQRALKNSGKPLWSLGPVIHNPQVVDFLSGQGLHVVNDLEQIGEGTIVISSHGVSPAIIGKARARGLGIIDATCPYVKKAQSRASDLVDDGYSLVVVGDRDHREVRGILEHVAVPTWVIQVPQDLKQIKPTGKIGVVVQTTQSPTFLGEVVSALTALTAELKVFNTICDATMKKQEAARELSERADIMLVVGGRNSANTTRLAEICGYSGTPTHHIEVSAEIDAEWFSGEDLVGITSGASTPDWILAEVTETLREISSAK
ncbi:MAG: 4-hydroxy-3-methylbut-2-enyl diphosphate reductase, partial [Terriglobia bacterium]